MARIRSIKPEFFRSRKLSERSVRARLTFIGLWTVCDDEGRYEYEPELLKADLWPFERDVTAEHVDDDVQDLAKHALVCVYETAGKRYLHVVNWHEHQKINRPSPSKLPECSRSTHAPDPEPSREVDPSRARAGSGSGSGSGSGEDQNHLVRDDDPDIVDAEIVPITDHPEATRLCNLLADAIAHNTGERPKIGKRWLDATRLMLDRDGYRSEQVEYLIRWSQSDQFWRANILSMPKLREKRLQLIAKIRAEHDRSNGTRDRLHAASVQELLTAGGGG